MSVSVCHSIHGIYSLSVCVCVSVCQSVTHWVLWSMQLCDSPACSSSVFSLLLLVLVFSMVWILWVWEETEYNTCQCKKKKKTLYGKCIAVYSQVSSVCFSLDAVVELGYSTCILWSTLWCFFLSLKLSVLIEKRPAQYFNILFLYSTEKNLIQSALERHEGEWKMTIFIWVYLLKRTLDQFLDFQQSLSFKLCTYTIWQTRFCWQ